MENRSDVVREYFDLIRYLNRSNKTLNEKTELVFNISQAEKGKKFGCYLKGKQNNLFLILCLKPKGKRWQSSGYTYFSNFEDYCKKFLNKNNDNLALLIQQLSSLGLKK